MSAGNQPMYTNPNQPTFTLRADGFTDSSLRFAPCPKCRQDDPEIVYMNGRHGRAAGGYPRECSHAANEHFDAECRRCGFYWRAEMDGSIT